MERVSLDVRENENIARRTNSWRDASGHRAWRRCGWRGPARAGLERTRRTLAPDSGRARLGARARVARPPACARAPEVDAGAATRARITHGIAIAFRLVVSCVRACACCACYPSATATPRPRAWRLCLGAFTSATRASTRTSLRSSGRAQVLPALPTTRGSFRIGTRAARRTDANGVSTRERIKNARIDFEPNPIWRSGFFRAACDGIFNRVGDLAM